MIEVRVPTVLRKYTNGERTIHADGGTVGQVIDDVEKRHPGFKEQVVSSEGQLHRFINCYLNDEDVRFLQSLDTATSTGDVVAILPAVAGGMGGRRGQRASPHPQQAWLGSTYTRPGWRTASVGERAPHPQLAWLGHSERLK